MCSVLWHSLDIWQCVKQGSEVLQETIQDFLSCSIDFKEDNWYAKETPSSYSLWLPIYFKKHIVLKQNGVIG